MSRNQHPKPEIDAAALERLALRYVERYATTRAKLRDYLQRKMRERGVTDPAPDPDMLVERIAALGYIDDLGFAQSKAAAMARRGLGARRVNQALYHAGIATEDTAQLELEIKARRVESAVAFARKRRIGPFADQEADRPMRERQIGQMLRAGHDFALARKIVDLHPGEDVEALTVFD